MGPTKTTKPTERGERLLTRLAMMICGAIMGSACLVVLVPTVLRWFNTAPAQSPLAVAGALAGACVVLVALALSSSSAPERERRDGVLIWMAPDPALMTPMAWTPGPIVVLDSSISPDAEPATARQHKQTAMAPRCSHHRPPVGHGSSRRIRRPQRALPLPPAEV